MEWEKEKHEKDHALSDRRLQAEIERGKAEIEFKNRELNREILYMYIFLSTVTLFFFVYFIFYHSKRLESKKI